MSARRQNDQLNHWALVADQDRFWASRRLLFERQGGWAGGAADAELDAATDTKRQVGANRFDARIKGRFALERVTPNLCGAQGVVKTAPTFITLCGGKGGALPAEKFAATLPTMLARFNGRGRSC